MSYTIFRKFLLFGIFMVLTLSIVACSKGGERKDSTVTEADGIPVYDKYASREIDLDLTEDETVLNVIEVEDSIRVTVGVNEWLYAPNSFEATPYRTEYRYYDEDYVEDTARREKTAAYHELAFISNPDVNFSFGGEPFEDVHDRGAQYHFYRDGEMSEEVIANMEDEMDPKEWSCEYGIVAQIMLYEDVPFVCMDLGSLEDGEQFFGQKRDLYINDRFLDTEKWVPGDPNYTYCGLIGINGVPYGLLEIDEKGVLVPLTPETTELPLEGTEIDGCPTGGAFTDGRFGYFLSNTELWRTDGKTSQRIADLVPHGVTKSSAVRAVSALSDGRLLVVTDGKLIELSGTNGTEKAETKEFTIGVLDYYGDQEEIKDLNLLVSKYNDQAENSFFRVKEYDDRSKLNLALLSGEVAMVITPDRLVLKNYVKQGLLADLEEAAPGLFEKDVLIENVVDATRIDGVCYYLPVNFEICGEAIADPSLLKDGKLFETRDEYYDYINANDPEYFKLVTPSDVLNTFTKDLDEWIDWESNTCHFDDGTLEALLEFCIRGSSNEELTDNFMAADLSARVWKANSFTLKDGVEKYRFTDVVPAIKYQSEIPEVGDAAKDPTAWVQLDFPMPSEVHDGYAINAHNLYAVVDNEDSRDAAADFLKWLILEDEVEEFPGNTMDPFYMTGWDGFSINREETDRYLRRLVNGTVDPEEIVATIKPEVASQYPGIVNSMRNTAIAHNMKCGQEQYEITWSYIENADHLQYYKNQISAVIHEEAGRYFGGMITAAQAAEYVQNRISIYLAEQS